MKQESIFDHHVTDEEIKAFNFTDYRVKEPPDDYIEYSSADKKNLDLALLYLYRFKLRTFQFYLSKVKDKTLFDECGEMLEHAMRCKFH